MAEDFGDIFGPSGEIAVEKVRDEVKTRNLGMRMGSLVSPIAGVELARFDVELFGIREAILVEEMRAVLLPISPGGTIS